MKSIKVNDYTLPDNFVAMTNVGENNKRYIDIIGEVTATSRELVQEKIDEILNELNTDENIIYIDNQRGINAIKNTSEGIIHDLFDEPHTAVVKLSYRAEDKSSYETQVNVSSTGIAIVYMEGSAESYPTITIGFTGASSTVSLVNDLSNQTFSLTHDFEPYDTLQINSSKHELLHNGLIMIDDSETAEFIKLMKGKNTLTLTADGSAEMLIEYEDKSL